MTSHRCGFVALLGRPNAGKSTLLNTLVGEKLAIVSDKAQTTRGRILGAVTRPGSQLLFHDTPGIHASERKWNQLLSERALELAKGADVRALLFESFAKWSDIEEQIASLPGPLVLVRTKHDPRKLPSAVPGLERFAAQVAVNALEKLGLEELLDVLVANVPESPALYPEDFLTDAPMRFLAAEQVREVAFEQFREDIPYSIGVEIESWEETAEDLRIGACLLVERDSQKGIVIGAGGGALRALGTEARLRMGKALEKRVHLRLFVKVDKNWTKRPKRAKELGYL